MLFPVSPVRDPRLHSVFVPAALYSVYFAVTIMLDEPGRIGVMAEDKLPMADLVAIQRSVRFQLLTLGGHIGRNQKENG